MAADLHTPSSRRLSVTLTEDDERELARLRSSSARISAYPHGLPEKISDAKLVRAVLAEGLRALRERELEADYAELGAEERERSLARRTQITSRRRGAAGIP